MTKPQSREKAEKIAKEIVKEWYLDCISPPVLRCDRLVNAIADALTPQLELLAECERALEPFARIAQLLQPKLPDDYKNTMAWAVPEVGQLRAAAALLAKIKEVGK